MIKYFDLDKEEEQVLTDFDAGDLKPVKQVSNKQTKEYVSYAKKTLEKARNINIRLTEKDLMKLRSRAAAEGVPYQTLVTSVLHRFASS